MRTESPQRTRIRAIQFNKASAVTAAKKTFGISVKMPENDPMSAPHLLGEDWNGTRWYLTAEERDAAFDSMKDHPRYYRRGDVPSIVLEKINP